MAVVTSRKTKPQKSLLPANTSTAYTRNQAVDGRLPDFVEVDNRHLGTGLFASFAPFNDVLDIILLKYFGFTGDTFKFHEGLPFGRVPVVGKFDLSLAFLEKFGAAASITYVLVMMGGQEIMRGFKPFTLKYPIFLHNAIMSVASAILFMLILEPLVPMIYEHGPNYAICSIKAVTPRLMMLYYFNFLFKIWEFIDTGFMVLRKRPLEFLHVYHHSATAGLAYLFLTTTQSAIWFPILLNLAVHVLMYYVILCRINHLKTQNLVEEALDQYANIPIRPRSWLKTEYGLRTVENCHSSDPHIQAVVTGIIISSYLALFLDFYFRSYTQAAAAKKNAIKTNGKAHHTNGHSNGNGVYNKEE
ncbi:very-long-chain 3-oxoacyl-CoA synthase [Synchytrium microbalum]|uniref:Elongation of fatty acids protein n=1 Tax=Synchytrium microbalum TaxID=1806994 RepID=A0A507CII6_9FUNG|nr:very-long-chain 3-oxoacyl-CoA synthase [Synchytrium microbalum]TPX37473.1 very-long-chain 3-oxoacyl-CoA synthase [Synchytrium microbalum]